MALLPLLARRLPAVLLLALLVATTDVLAQVPTGPPGGMAAMAGRVTGTVVDAETGEPLPMATVAVFLGGEFITGAAAGNDGAFDVSPLRPGTYEVRVSSVGYATHRIADVAVRPASPAALGTIRLEGSTAQLGEAEVVAQRDLVEVRADRTVYNVADQPVTAGGSAIEVLQTLPSVEVDLDGNLSLRGNQNVAIHVNGSPVPLRGAQLASFLRQVPAGQVERVEVLPNPSARYEADAMGGIINIVLKQGVSRGLSGGFTVGGGTAPNAEASGNVAYQRGPVDVYASYGFRYDDFSLEGAGLRQNFLAPEDSLFLDQVVGSGRSNASHILNSTFDYTLRPGLNLATTGMLSFRTGETENTNAYRYLDALGVESSAWARTSEGLTSGLNANGSVRLRRAWQPQRHELTALARYTFNRSGDDERFTQTRPNGSAPLIQLNDQTNQTGEAIVQVDYVRPVREGRVEAGTRAGLRRIDNDILGQEVDPSTGQASLLPGRTNAFEHAQDVFATYLQGAQKVGPVELQAGVRLEHTSIATTWGTSDRTYTDLFPSAFASYSPWVGGTFRAGYSRRINRPHAMQLNPFETFDDPLNVRRGNPDLRPEYVDSFELTASQFLPFGMVSLTPFYRRTTNVIRPRFLFEPATNVTTFTMENLDVDDSYGADATLALRFGQRLQGFVSGSVFRTVTSAGSIETGLGTDAIAYSMRGNLTSRLRPGLDVQAFGFWRSPMTSIDGRMSSFAMTSIGLRQHFMDERASLSLRVNDVLNTTRFEFHSANANFVQDGFRDPQLQRVDLTFTYTFGQVSQQQRRQRQQQDMPQIPQDDFGF
jgi:outer membrane receptor protein involved in Fe transport